MKIIICGGGQTGQAICEALWKTNDITLIDKDEQVINELFSQYDIQVVHGSALSPQILSDAGVEEADVFIAVTNDDEVNIVTSNFAKKLGAYYVCARVRRIGYYEDRDFTRQALNLDQIINPEFRSAELMNQVIHFPEANNIENFADGNVQIFELPINATSPLIDLTVNDFGQQLSSDVLVCVIKRGDDILIPTGDDHFEAEDTIYVTGLPKDIKSLTKSLHLKTKPLRNLFIIGGGTLTYFLLQKLPTHHFHIKVIESNRMRASELAQAFPNIEVINGDGTNQQLLLEEGLKYYDASLALTNHDETNILINLFAHSEGIEKNFTLVNRPYLLKPLTHMGLDTVITPKRAAAEKIIRLVRNHKATQQSTVTHFYQLVPNEVEALEFKILNHGKITTNPLTDLELIDQTLLLNIQRDNQRIIPSGDTQIQVGDLVSIVTKHKDMNDINDFVK